MAEKKIPFDRQVDINEKNKNNHPRKKRSIFKILLLVILLIFIIGSGATAAIVTRFASEAPELDTSKLATVETSYLFDVHGEEITALHEEQNRLAVSLNQIPTHVQEAFIAIEDERFYDHFGFDIIGNIRAAYTNLRAGRIVQGASTISQQLAQNAFLTTETTYKRKVQEIWLAIQLEQIYGKNEILEMYLNRIYFGNGAYGVEAASQTYFDKSAEEINVNEAAMLAGAVQSPNFFNPFDNQAEAEARMRIVLANMHRQEMLTEDEYNQALNRQISYATPKTEEYPFPHFVDYVVHEELIDILTAMPNIDSRQEAYMAIYTDGLRVYTTLDPDMQNHVESVLANEELYPTTIYVNMSEARTAIASLGKGQELTRSQLEDLSDEETGVAQPQAAIVLADPESGQIQALGGGREYRKEVDEILRFKARRQPGSAIKPIITYGPAFEEGTLAGAGSTLDDSPYIGPRGDWFPENFDYEFRGFIPARDALYYSYNIPAIRAFEDLGPQVGAQYAQDMGITTLHPDEMDNISLTLGGFTRGVSAIDMAQAYCVLANKGVKVDLHTVERIEDRYGEVIYEYQPEPEQVLSPQSAFLVNDILQDFVTEYLGRALQIDRPVAAKTGTTDDWKDVYLAAYTPNLVATFWMGYDEPKMGSIQQGWRYSTAFLREVFLEAFEDLEVREFERPDGIVRVTVCSRSGLLPTNSCQDADSVRTDYFIAGQVPTETCDMHEGRFYNRPPYIITDERWSSRGGPGRGPQDAEEMPADPRFLDMAEQRGNTTEDITLFNAYVTEDGVTLQWEYDGPDVSSFILQKVSGETGEEISEELSGNTRQYSDPDIEMDTSYTYSLAARQTDGTVSDPATVAVSTVTTSGGGFAGQRDDSGPVVVPDVTGKFSAIAEMELSRAGLRPVIEKRYNEEVRINRVIEQIPAAGTTLTRNREVTLIVSIGTDPDN
ncbi:MAG: PBP1A family penicillin-binding protein [Bacillota bacterium]